jgi:carbamate kinase
MNKIPTRNYRELQLNILCGLKDRIYQDVFESGVKMNGTVVVLVNGEVLANGEGSKISDQRLNAKSLVENLSPIFTSDLKIVVLHGNKPQVGFVLFRSELSTHVLHSVPLDVCGADTQGATGYILSQAFMNVLKRDGINRNVVNLMTQTLVDGSLPVENIPVKTIGPWFDRDKADLLRQTRKWNMIEEPGRGYRRAVPTYPALEVLEIETIQQLVEAGNIVIACGGGGVPVVRNAQGYLEGVETVVDTELVANLVAHQLKAQTLLMIIESDVKFILSGLSTEREHHLHLEELDRILTQENIQSTTVLRKLNAASQFLHGGGEEVIITTLRKLPETLTGHNGLRIGSTASSIKISQSH